MGDAGWLPKSALGQGRDHITQVVGAGKTQENNYGVGVYKQLAPPRPQPTLGWRRLWAAQPGVESETGWGSHRLGVQDKKRKGGMGSTPRVDTWKDQGVLVSAHARSTLQLFC